MRDPRKRIRFGSPAPPDRLRSVSTDEQGTDPQLDELRDAGCVAIHHEHTSGADRSRPVLARLLREISSGETLVVVRLDRMARSVSHLLTVTERLDTKGAFFRGLRDPTADSDDAVQAF
jgi:DNA invertase Pin-like site-specific DNA recombinase